MRFDLMRKLKIQSIENDFEFFYQIPFLSSHCKYTRTINGRSIKEIALNSQFLKLETTVINPFIRIVSFIHIWNTI